ncbi:hypothetical protein FKP32DRAFT_1594490 [Trametes sanguinea]|nr:hypothetical protein FKP32DRAFT_1594490 [Trametes sanguinea]
MSQRPPGYLRGGQFWESSLPPRALDLVLTAQSAQSPPCTFYSSRLCPLSPVDSLLSFCFSANVYSTSRPSLDLSRCSPSLPAVHVSLCCSSAFTFCGRPARTSSANQPHPGPFAAISCLITADPRCYSACRLSRSHYAPLRPIQSAAQSVLLYPDISQALESQPVCILNFPPSFNVECYRTLRHVCTSHPSFSANGQQQAACPPCPIHITRACLPPVCYNTTQHINRITPHVSVNVARKQILVKLLQLPSESSPSCFVHIATSSRSPESEYGECTPFFGHLGASIDVPCADFAKRWRGVGETMPNRARGPQ